ncbi:MAG: sugar phosphate isomerase/epimerase [Verrucomicrobia bacterium]|nr:sugar phosphate isomerase/epimerase [Verrucomicrobiota bacterium]
MKNRFPTAVTVSLVPEARGGPFVYWDDLDAAISTAAELGFDAIEIFPPSPDVLDARRLRQKLTEHGIKLAAMGTGAGWVVQKLRLTDPDPMIRSKARAFVASIIDFAGRLGAPAIIGSMQGRVDPGTDRGQVLAWMTECLDQLGPRAHQFGVPLLLEPLNRYETNLFNNVGSTLDYLTSLRTQNIKLLCDCFHMNIEEASIEDALRQAGSRLGHVHLADSNRRAAGLGHIPFEPIFRTLTDIGYQGYVSAEVLPLPDTASAARATILAVRS